MNVPVPLAGLDDPTRHRLAVGSLVGLSVGDALGERFFWPKMSFDGWKAHVTERRLPLGLSTWTDDTAMACSIVDEVTAGTGTIDLDALAASFAAHFDLARGYGPAATTLLIRWAHVDHRRWAADAAALFDGAGSYGNGAAMRVAPLGAWHADDPARAAAAARRQAAVTHTHPEAGAGAAAVAAMAAVLAGSRQGAAPSFGDLLELAADAAGPSRVADRLRITVGLGPDAVPFDVAETVGSGRDIAAWDTVPFALWSAACSPDDFPATFWRTIAGLGDRDTTCAIACGTVAARTGEDGIPDGWRAVVEPLPDWVRTLH